MHRLLQIGNKKALCMALKSAMLPVPTSIKDSREGEKRMTRPMANPQTQRMVEGDKAKALSEVKEIEPKIVPSVPTTETTPEQVTFVQVNQQVAKRKAAAALHDMAVKAWSEAGARMSQLKAQLQTELDAEDRLNLLFGYQAAKAIFAAQGGLTEAQMAMWKVDGQGNPLSIEKPEGLGAVRPLASGNADGKRTRAKNSYIEANDVRQYRPQLLAIGVYNADENLSNAALKDRMEKHPHFAGQTIRIVHPA